MMMLSRCSPTVFIVYLLCEALVSPCASAPCKNGATCFYSGSRYKCVCRSGYTGKTCTDTTVSNPCDPNPCLNEGTCTPYGQNYECGCAAGYDGRNCEEPTTVCTLNCQNGGTCVPMPPTNGNCNCAVGWGGTLCTDRTCEGFCLNGGACSMVNGNPTCSCGDGFNGIQCENICDLTCVNGLCIFNSLDQPTCNCDEGFQGTLCEIPV